MSKKFNEKILDDGDQLPKTYKVYQAGRSNNRPVFLYSPDDASVRLYFEKNQAYWLKHATTEEKCRKMQLESENTGKLCNRITVGKACEENNCGGTGGLGMYQCKKTVSDCIPHPNACYRSCFESSNEKDWKVEGVLRDGDTVPEHAYYIAAASYYLSEHYFCKTCDIKANTNEIRKKVKDAEQMGNVTCGAREKEMDDLVTKFKKKFPENQLPKVLVLIRDSKTVHPELNMNPKTFSEIVQGFTAFHGTLGKNGTVDKNTSVELISDRQLWGTIGQNSDYLGVKSKSVPDGIEIYTNHFNSGGSYLDDIHDLNGQPLQNYGVFLQEQHRLLEDFWDKEPITSGPQRFGRKKCIQGFFARLQEEGCLIIGFRSGTLDAAAFVGMPTLAIDLYSVHKKEFSLGYERHKALEAIHEIAVVNKDNISSRVRAFLSKHIKDAKKRGRCVEAY